MDIRRLKVADLLCTQQQFVLLDLQQGNRWSNEQLQQFWDDVKCLSNSQSDTNRLFLGNIILAGSTLRLPSVSQLEVVDGQHRLVAFTMLLAAVRDWEASSGRQEKASELQNTYLCHPFRSGTETHKLVFAGDPPSHLPLISYGKRPGTLSWPLRFYDFFCDKISEGGFDAGHLSWAMLSRTDIIAITDDYRSAVNLFLSVATKGKPTPSTALGLRHSGMQAASPPAN